MRLPPIAQLFSILCCLVSVACGLKMTVSNSTMEVEKTTEKLSAEYRLKKSTSSISISCSISDTTQLKSPVINWQRLDRRPSAKLEVTSSIAGDGLSFVSKLTIEHPQNANISAYVCTGEASGKNVSAVAAFLSRPLLEVDANGGGVNALPSSMPLDLVAYPDLALTLTCMTFGFPVGASKWFRQSDQGQETPVGDGFKLKLDRLSYGTDRSHYVCRSSNELGENSLRLYLRVQNPKAYLAPMILLIVLVVIVIVIVIVYELCQRQRRQKLAREIADENKAQ